MKRELFRNKIQFLGQIINGNGIGPDPKKWAIVANYPQPRNESEFRTFLGLTLYLRNFVPTCAKQAEILTRLLRYDLLFVWTEKHEVAVQTLKSLLVNPLAFAFPIPNLPYKLVTDESNYAIGAVLMQKEHGIERAVYYWCRNL